MTVRDVSQKVDFWVVTTYFKKKRVWREWVNVEILK